MGSGNKIVFDPDWAGNEQQNGEKDASFSFGSSLLESSVDAALKTTGGFVWSKIRKQIA